MALRRCRECTTAFAVGLLACPHCQSTEHEEDDGMPKITRHGGPTIAGASVVGGSWGNEGDPDVWPEPKQTDEEPAAGPDYETWTVEELKAQLDKRGLPKTGKKDDLVLRLLEDDDTRTTAPEDTE